MRLFFHELKTPIIRSGDEDDGYDETLIPVDFQRTGQIVDDDVRNVLVRPMRKGVVLTCIMDCCHSGTGSYCIRCDTLLFSAMQ